LTEDEQLSPTFEDFILANLLYLINIRLPGCVRECYQHLIGKTKILMDYRNDILTGVPVLLSEIENKLYSVSKIDVDGIER
jgi:hypothetical protein